MSSSRFLFPKQVEHYRIEVYVVLEKTMCGTPAQFGSFGGPRQLISRDDRGASLCSLQSRLQAQNVTTAERL